MFGKHKGRAFYLGVCYLLYIFFQFWYVVFYYYFNPFFVSFLVFKFGDRSIDQTSPPFPEDFFSNLYNTTVNATNSTAT